MIYLCAGMYRSGSTWLYNATRITLIRSGVSGLAAGWIKEKDALLKSSNAVIKVHAFDAELAKKADVILVSHRDLRDVAASLHRKFQTDFSTKILHETFSDYSKWKKLAKYDLRYESFLINPRGELEKLANALKLPPATVRTLPYDDILKDLQKEKFEAQRSTGENYDSLNLLHSGHITDGRHGSWAGLVPDEIVKAIEAEFHDWMSAESYLNHAPHPFAKEIGGGSAAANG